MVSKVWVETYGKENNLRRKRNSPDEMFLWMSEQINKRTYYLDSFSKHYWLEAFDSFAHL